MATLASKKRAARALCLLLTATATLTLVGVPAHAASLSDLGAPGPIPSGACGTLNDAVPGGAAGQACSWLEDWCVDLLPPPLCGIFF